VKVYTNWNGQGWDLYSDKGKMCRLSAEVGREVGLVGDAETGELVFTVKERVKYPHPEIVKQIFIHGCSNCGHSV
jgi:hypothetical protein